VKSSHQLHLLTGIAVSLAATMSVFGQQPADEAPSAKPDPDALVNAIAALGGSHLLSIKFTGSGTIVPNSEAPAASNAPRGMRGYEVAIDYPASAMQIDLTPEAAASLATASPAGPQVHQIEAINGTVAWDMAVTVAPATAGHKKAGGKPANVSAVSVTEPPRLNAAASLLRRQAIWMTPHGFLKAALANQPALRPAGAGTEVSFYAGTNRYVGFLNSKHQVERVRTWVRRPEGDLLLDVTYTDYAMFGSVSFPTRIRQLQNGQLMLDVTITDVQPNVPVRVPVPPGLAAP
jgi:hypothetical protein